MKSLTILALLFVTTSPAIAQMGPPPAMPSSAIDKAVTGTEVRFVIRVDSVKRSTVSGHILDRVTDSDYKASGSTIAVYAPNDLKVIMGSRDDLKPGAIVYFFATTTKPHAADASKMVVLTQYVKVE